MFYRRQTFLSLWIKMSSPNKTAIAKCKMTTKTPTKPCPSYTESSMLLPERTLFKNDSETVIRLFLQLRLLITAITLCIRTALFLIGLTPALYPFPPRFSKHCHCLDSCFLPLISSFWGKLFSIL